MSTNDIQATQSSTITLTAALNDDSINSGKVIFKINGKTVKDANSKVIYAKIVNGTANVEYALPASMKVSSYTITATYMPISGEKLTSEATLLVTKE
ncbi:hypothetical protein [Methanosphaera sp. BMS]|uniref:hypothetical protein n=1 Tax=Methanosphaera sp. BMS TaxID=1789762 RepID=UPI000DC1E154|nr:hypothetical protein [Methanosphaera sp. BMS]AWX32644.1 hypothetical protein AW729_05835 [Methanosphaera sp. BMS]